MLSPSSKGFSLALAELRIRDLDGQPEQPSFFWSGTSDFLRAWRVFSEMALDSLFTTICNHQAHHLTSPDFIFSYRH